MRLLSCPPVGLLFLSALLLGEAGWADPLDGVTWAPTTETGSFEAVVFAGNGFVAVAPGGAIKESDDGLLWSTVASSTRAALHSVAWGEGTCLAAGDGGTILESKDRKSWRQNTSGTSLPLYGVTFWRGTWVAVGAQGVILASPDGRRWKTVLSGTNQTLRGVAGNDNLLVVVGDGSTLLTSQDGRTWAPAVLPSLASNPGDPQKNFTGRAYRRVLWLDGGFIATGTIQRSAQSYPLVTFSDAGGQWKDRVLPGSSDQSSPVSLAGGARFGAFTFFAGSDGRVLSFSSPTCEKCTSTRSLSPAALFDLAAGPDRLVAVGAGGIFAAVKEAGPPHLLISYKAVVDKLNKGALLLDVRTPEEYQAGHLDRALNVPVDVLPTAIGAVTNDLDQELVVYCAKGVRSRKAFDLLRKMGYRLVYDLGGISFPFVPPHD